ncbi:hypothetical protein C8F04DRAFT_1286980 [Mycena alexandri]|uniref:Uncharacterized protein n=1 Tax=Mycena alexandri TaxID=1745969 RepID=A0AAD6TCU2_9AGAR|nr:hypothetical protein C8F04DRAFT_1286980 [Mycena alexandri]
MLFCEDEERRRGAGRGGEHVRGSSLEPEVGVDQLQLDGVIATWIPYATKKKKKDPTNVKNSDDQRDLPAFNHNFLRSGFDSASIFGFDPGFWVSYLRVLCCKARQVGPGVVIICILHLHRGPGLIVVNIRIRIRHGGGGREEGARSRRVGGKPNDHEGIDEGWWRADSQESTRTLAAWNFRENARAGTVAFEKSKNKKIERGMLNGETSEVEHSGWQPAIDYQPPIISTLSSAKFQSSANRFAQQRVSRPVQIESESAALARRWIFLGEVQLKDVHAIAGLSRPRLELRAAPGPGRWKGSWQSSRNMETRETERGRREGRKEDARAVDHWQYLSALIISTCPLPILCQSTSPETAMAMARGRKDGGAAVQRASTLGDGLVGVGVGVGGVRYSQQRAGTPRTTRSEAIAWKAGASCRVGDLRVFSNYMFDGSLGLLFWRALGEVLKSGRGDRGYVYVVQEDRR